MRFSPLGTERLRLWYDRAGLKDTGVSFTPLADTVLTFFAERGTSAPYRYVRRDGQPVPPFYAKAADFILEDTPQMRAAIAMMWNGQAKGDGLDHLARFWLSSNAERRVKLEELFADEFKQYGGES